MFRLFECCALSFFERFVLSFSLKIERFVSDSAEIWICGLYSQYVQANNLKELCPDLEKDEILLIEHPVLKSNPLPPALLNEASINLLVVRANRTWKNTDQALYEHLLQVKQKEVPLLFYLTQADRNTVEDFTGQLPPYTNFKNMEYRLFQLGLTAIEYKGK